MQQLPILINSTGTSKLNYPFEFLYLLGLAVGLIVDIYQLQLPNRYLSIN